MAKWSKLAFLILIMQVTAAVGCSKKKDCRSCSDTKFLGVRCRWCPLTNACHAPGSVKNDCSKSQQVTSSSKCAAVTQPQTRYDSNLAETLAKFSSLAYVRPGSYDKDSIQKAVSAHIGPGYKVVEFVTHDCDLILEFDFCGAVISKSTQDNQIVVAFRGTTSNGQLVEQFLKGFTGTENFSPTGGKVLKYNGRTHAGLYPCVKDVVQELLKKEPSLKVIVTGHSLGGAQAELTAANLLSDGVTSKSNLAVYTFGSPRVGNRDFAFGYDRLVGESWRVVRDNDPVPLIVPKSILKIPLAYHTHREIFYNVKDTLLITPQTPYIVCGGNEDSKRCAASEIICLLPHCLTKVHLDYFVYDITEYAKSYLQKGTPPATGRRGNCLSYKFS